MAKGIKKEKKVIKKFGENRLNGSKSDDDSKKGKEKSIELVDINKLEKKIKKLYNDYYLAKKYFCSNDFKEKELNAIQETKKNISSSRIIKERKT